MPAINTDSGARAVQPKTKKPKTKKPIYYAKVKREVSVPDQEDRVDASYRRDRDSRKPPASPDQNDRTATSQSRQEEPSTKRLVTTPDQLDRAAAGRKEQLRTSFHKGGDVKGDAETEKAEKFKRTKQYVADRFAAIKANYDQASPEEKKRLFGDPTRDAKNTPVLDKFKADERELQAAGVGADALSKAYGVAIKEGAIHPSLKVMELLGRPSHVLAAIAQNEVENRTGHQTQNPGERLLKNATGKQHTGSADAYEAAGVLTGNDTARAILGAVTDVTTDPLNAVTLGAATPAEIAARGASRAVLREAPHDLERAASEAGKASAGKATNRGIHVSLRIPGSGREYSTSGRGTAALSRGLGIHSAARAARSDTKVGRAIDKLGVLAPDLRPSSEGAAEFAQRREGARHLRADLHRKSQQAAHERTAIHRAGLDGEDLKHIERAPLDAPPLHTEMRDTPAYAAQKELNAATAKRKAAGTDLRVEQTAAKIRVSQNDQKALNAARALAKEDPNDASAVIVRQFDDAKRAHNRATKRVSNAKKGVTNSHTNPDLYSASERAQKVAAYHAAIGAAKGTKEELRHATALLHNAAERSAGRKARRDALHQGTVVEDTRKGFASVRDEPSLVYKEREVREPLDVAARKSIARNNRKNASDGPAARNKITATEAFSTRDVPVERTGGTPNVPAHEAEWFHGTPTEFEGTPSAQGQWSDLGVYLTTDPHYAKGYSVGNGGEFGHTVPIRVSPKKVLDMRAGRHSNDDMGAVLDKFSARIDEAIEADLSKDHYAKDPHYRARREATLRRNWQGPIDKWKAILAKGPLSPEGSRSLQDDLQQLSESAGAQLGMRGTGNRHQLLAQAMRDAGFDAVRKVDKHSDALVVLDESIMHRVSGVEGTPAERVRKFLTPFAERANVPPRRHVTGDRKSPLERLGRIPTKKVDKANANLEGAKAEEAAALAARKAAGPMTAKKEQRIVTDGKDYLRDVRGDLRRHEPETPAQHFVRERNQQMSREDVESGAIDPHQVREDYTSHVQPHELERGEWKARHIAFGTKGSKKAGHTLHRQYDVSVDEAKQLGHDFSEDVGTVHGHRVMAGGQRNASIRFGKKIIEGRPKFTGQEFSRDHEGVYAFNPKTGRLAPVDPSTVKAAINTSKYDKNWYVLNRSNADNAMAVTEKPGARTSALNKINGFWKTAVTQWNPAYHVGNEVGNRVMAWQADTTVKAWNNSHRMVRLLAKRNKWEKSNVTPGAKFADTLSTKPARTRSGVKSLSDAELWKYIDEAEGEGALSSGVASHELQYLSGKNPGRIRRFGERRENQPRLATYLSARQRGMTPKEAAEWTNKHHIDYGDLTKAEKGLRDLGIPFYTFTARNTRLQGQKLLERPNKAANFELLREDVNKHAGEDPGFEKALKRYQQAGMPFVLRIGGVSMLLTPRTPIDQGLAKLLGNPKDWADTIGSSIGAVYKTPVELWGDYSFFRKQHIEEGQGPSGDGQVEAPPEIAKLIQKIPVLGEYAKVEKGEDGKWYWRAKTDYVINTIPAAKSVKDAFLPRDAKNPYQQTRAQSAASAVGVKLSGIDPKLNAYGQAVEDWKAKTAKLKTFDRLTPSKRGAVFGTDSKGVQHGLNSPERQRLVNDVSKSLKKMNELNPKGKQPTFERRPPSMEEQIKQKIQDRINKAKDPAAILKDRELKLQRRLAKMKAGSG